METVDVELREQIQETYREVLTKPNSSFHFHSGRVAAERAEYEPAWLEGVPESSLGSFAGVANAFHWWGLPAPSERVVDVGCGADADSLIEAGPVGGGQGHYRNLDLFRSVLGYVPQDDSASPKETRDRSAGRRGQSSRHQRFAHLCLRRDHRVRIWPGIDRESANGGRREEGARK